jgi:hypothetical protein
MRNMYRKVIPGDALQEFDWDEMDVWTADAYVRVMTRYLEDRKRIPEERLFELRYEDLDERPLEVLPALYAHLGLGGWEQARPALTAYLDSLGRFEKNRFEFPGDVVEVVNAKWGFALDAFGYARIEPGEVPR